ncbi:unnamed protein product [Heterobilharzia americana]|nr:unnamed protein product [Heterobilharzia americana]
MMVKHLLHQHVVVDVHKPWKNKETCTYTSYCRRNLKGELVDPDEADRRMKRRERNRKSAQKCRERKVQRTQELQSQVECLQLEASRLMQELDSWRSRARQCVALLQHHCPGVSVPYLSCLTEVPACLSDYKEPIDNLGDLTGQDKNMDCESQQYTWKMKSSTKTYTINETSDGIFMSNESSQLLPPMNLLHSNITSNRSKSLLTFSSNNSGKDNENQIFSQNSELNKISLVNHNNHDISGTLLIPMSRSTSKASIHGPASASSSSSSSSSCSTYELSFPSLENHSHCLNESNTFKDYTQVNPLSIIDKRDRSRVLSGQNLLDNSPISISVKSIPVGNTNSNQQTWSLEYHETSGKKNSSMDCCSPLSPLNTITNETNTMTNHLQNSKDYPIKMDSECYTECGNSKMLNKT